MTRVGEVVMMHRVCVSLFSIAICIAAIASGCADTGYAPGPGVPQLVAPSPVATGPVGILGSASEKRASEYIHADRSCVMLAAESADAPRRFGR